MSAVVSKPSIPKGAGFFRRLAAWLYDFMVLIAIEMFAIGIALGATSIATMLGLSTAGYEDTSALLVQHPVIGPLFSFYVFAVVAGFYSYFWCKAGQTLGMKAWKLKIVSTSGGNITLTQALIRLATACFGAGNLLVFIDKNNSAFQDLFAHTQIVHVPN